MARNLVLAMSSQYLNRFIRSLILATVRPLQRGETTHIKRLKQMRRVRGHTQGTNLVLLAVLVGIDQVVTLVAV